MAVFLGLLVALAYGSGDFFGGLSAKRNPATSVVAVSQLFGLLILVVGFVAVRPDLASGKDLALGAVSGLIGVVGVVLLYRGLAGGAMGVVAPLTGVGAAVLPVGWGLVTGERPSALAMVGVIAALAAIALVAGGEAKEEERTAGRKGVLLALGAGAAFGGVFIVLASTSDDAGFWPLVSARGASVGTMVLVALAGRLSFRVDRDTLPVVALAGILDVTANGLFLLAAREGLLSLVAVLSSLYPAATAFLARVFLAERLQPPQLAGVGLALFGVTLIAAG
jgi:drug/metabolite transporter (DMT)-like permease